MPPSKKIAVKPPKKATLQRYGLSLEDWWGIVQRQKGLCPVCQQPFGDRKLAVDHVHAHRWRHLKPAVRKTFVRGVLHSFCNRYVRGWLTLSRAAAILAYLQDYERRTK